MHRDIIYDYYIMARSRTPKYSQKELPQNGRGIKTYSAQSLQKGYGMGGSIFRGRALQRGHGIGGLFRGLFRIAAPMIKRAIVPVGKKILKTAGKRALKAASKAAKKVLTSKSSLKEAAKQGAMEMFQFGDEEGNQGQQNAINRRPVKRKATISKKAPRSKVKRTHTGKVIAPDNL